MLFSVVPPPDLDNDMAMTNIAAVDNAAHTNDLRDRRIIALPGPHPILLLLSSSYTLDVFDDEYTSIDSATVDRSSSSVVASFFFVVVVVDDSSDFFRRSEMGTRFNGTGLSRLLAVIEPVAWDDVDRARDGRDGVE
jgi:hypothetical protein